MATIEEAKQELERRRMISEAHQELARRKEKAAIQTDVAPQQPTESLSLGEAGKQAISNIPSSALEVGKSIYQTFRHPIEAGKTLRDVAVGGLQRFEEATAIPKGQGYDPYPEDTPEMQNFSGTKNYFVDRFGGWENLKKTMAKDPIGFLMDLSVVLGGAGTAAKGAGTVSKIGGLTKAGKVLKTAGGVIDPVKLATKPLEAVGKLRQYYSQRLTKAVLKFPEELGLNRIDNLADAFLAKGITIKRGSLDKLDVDIKAINKAINNIVDKKTAEGLLIKTDDIVKSLDDLVSNARKRGFELPDWNTVIKMKKEFKTLNGQILTPRQVQDLKIGYGGAFKPNLGNRFGQVRDKVRDKLRTQAKLEIEKLHPEIKTLNSNESVMIKLKEAINSKILSHEKSPTIPVRGLVAGGIAGGLLYQDVQHAATFAALSFIADKVLTSPRVQIAVANALHRAKIKGLTAKRVGQATSSAFQAGRLKREDEKARPGGISFR